MVDRTEHATVSNLLCRTHLSRPLGVWLAEAAYVIDNIPNSVRRKDSGAVEKATNNGTTNQGVHTIKKSTPAMSCSGPLLFSTVAANAQLESLQPQVPYSAWRVFSDGSMQVEGAYNCTPGKHRTGMQIEGVIDGLGQGVRDNVGRRVRGILRRNR